MRILGVWLLLAAFSSALTVSLASPSNATITSTATQSFSFSMDAPANSCSLYANASGTWAPVASGANVSSFSYTLPAEGQYRWAVACSDANGTVFSENRSIRLDTTAPTAPSNLASSGTSPAFINWTASTDASPVTYLVFRNGTNVANASVAQYSDTVPSGMSYVYVVQAVDAPGLYSSNSSALTVLGPAASAAISNLAVVATSSAATFTWTASPAANASVSWSNGSTVLGAASSSSLSTSASLAASGLLPATNYSYTVTACASACANASGTFKTLPSSAPVPSAVQVSNTTAGTSVVFSALWTDSLNLSSYVFSSNASGTWTNSTYVFSSAYSNHTAVLPLSTVTVSWLFYANNSQDGRSQTALMSFDVSIPAATVTPSANPTIIATPLPTIPPELVHSVADTPTPTPEPTLTPEATPTPTATPAPTPAFSGGLGDLVLDAASADFGLSPTGLVIAVQSENATLVLSSNFSNAGDDVTVILKAVLNASDGSNRTFELNSQPATVEKNQTLLLQTVPAGVPAGNYSVTASVLSADTGALLDSKALDVQVSSSYTGYETAQGAPAILGALAILGVGAFLVAGQLNAVRKEFA